MPIQEQIKQIVKIRREKRLPKIQQEKEFIKSVLSGVNNLDDLIHQIKFQCETKRGPYYAILAGDLSMEHRLFEVSTADTLERLRSFQTELDRLEKRFSRGNVSIQVFGMAGSGKSTFIQSVTGLDNDVVLASEGGHCTGVSSFIYNSDHFETRVYLYTENEMLALFNKNLEVLEKKFNPVAPAKLLGNFQEIGEFKLESVGLPASMDGRLSVMKYVDNFSLISNLISGRDAKGEMLSGLKKEADGHFYVEITDSKQVQQWVAQHNGYHTSDTGHYVAYLNYLAVDRVDIYKKFLFEEVGDIVLMDNVGLGDASNDVSTEQHMYQAIADNSDAVILLYQPKPNSGWRGEEDAINSRLNNIRFKNAYQKIERMDVNELYFLLNERTTPGFDNSQDCPEVIAAFRAQPYERKETILVANASDVDSTREKALIPILEQLMRNLDKIDSRMMEKANSLGEELYVSYKMLCDSVASVVAGGALLNATEGALFDRLYKKLNYSEKLGSLQDIYQKKKSVPCDDVRTSIDGVIDQLVDLVPDEKECIYPDVAGRAMHIQNIFTKHIDSFRNIIFDSFENVNTTVLMPLQEQVKDEMISILFKEGKMGLIPLLNYPVEDGIEQTGAPQKWLKSLISEKVRKEKYPKLYDALNFILDYNLSIEGLIEYNVAKCIDTIDPESGKCPVMQTHPALSIDDQTHEIWEMIVNLTTPIQNSLREWRDDFSLIPSHSFYARVRKFRDKMVFGDEESKENIKEFYRDNRLSVWRDDFAGLDAKDQAFGNWNKMSGDIVKLCEKNRFKIEI